MSDESPQPIRVPVVEEELSVGTQTVKTGSVRVRSELERIVKVVETPFTHSVIDVIRVPVDREVSEIPEIRQDGEDLIVPIVEEEIVVHKRLVLKEEIHLRRRRIEEKVSREVTLDRQNAIVERLDSQGNVIA